MPRPTVRPRSRASTSVEAVGLEGGGHRMVSGLPRVGCGPQDRGELGAVGQAGLVAERRGSRGSARVAHVERRGEVRTVEPGGDEPGTERVARPRPGRPPRGVARRAGRSPRRASSRSTATAPVAPSLTTATDGPSSRAARASSTGSWSAVSRVSDRQLVRAAEDDVGARGERAQDRGSGLVRPEAAAQVDVEADRQAGRAWRTRSRARSRRGRRRRGRG